MTLNAGYAKTIKASGTVVKGASGSLTKSRAMLDINTFGNDHNKRLAGLKDFPGSISGPYDSADPGVILLEAAHDSGTAIPIQYLFDGTTGFQVDQFVESFELSAEVAGVIQYTASMQSNSDITAVP